MKKKNLNQRSPARAICLENEMKLSTTFNLGDKVHWINREYKKTQVTCPSCAGKGKITLSDGEKYTCPKCIGRCYQIKTDILKWHPLPKFTLGQVTITISDSPGIDGEDRFDNFKPKKDREERYMAIETGIGSGTLYNVKDLFATQEEAQTECDKRNKEENDKRE